jgi:hypothetical protein
MNPKGNKRLDSLFVRRCHRQLLKAMVDEKQDVNRSKASNIFFCSRFAEKAPSRLLTIK